MYTLKTVKNLYSSKSHWWVEFFSLGLLFGTYWSLTLTGFTFLFATFTSLVYSLPSKTHFLELPVMKFNNFVHLSFSLHSKLMVASSVLFCNWYFGFYKLSSFRVLCWSSILIVFYWEHMSSLMLQRRVFRQFMY